MLRFNAMTKTLSEWKRKASDLEEVAIEHIIKYQLWKMNCHLKEIFAYTSPLGKYKLKNTNNYPSVDLIKQYLLASIDDYSQYCQAVRNILFIYKKDFPKPKRELNKKLYENFIKFVDEWSFLLSQGKADIALMENLAKKYL